MARESVVVPEIGKYHLVAELARGGMGIIYLAVAHGPAGFNKLLAIKELKPEMAEDEGYVAMFLEEARLAARLNHPNIVQTNEVGSEGQRHYMVMEFLDGRSLHRVARRLAAKGGGLPLGAHLRVISEALLGLHYAHELRDFDGQPLNVVHRDVSPLNVFVTFDGQAKVIDFGIAKAVDSSLETRAGVLKGRVAYMAPEQAWGSKVDRRADLYSIGVMIWEAVAGRRLWAAQTDVEILTRILREGPPSLRSIRPDVPEDLEAICARAMAKLPEDRYATAVDLHEDLEEHLARRDDALRMRDIGALMDETFAEDRLKMRAIIEETLTRFRSGPRSGVMPTLESPVSGLQSAASLLRDQSLSQLSASRSIAALPRSYRAPAIAVDSLLSPGTSSAPGAEGGAIEAGRRWASRRAIVAAAIGGAMVLLVGGLAAALHDRSPPVQPAAIPPPARPAMATAPDTPEVIDLVVRVSPASAQITIDGASVATNPFHAHYPKDGLVHHVLASADGYDSKLEDVSFSSDVAIDVSLDRRPAPQVHRLAPPPPAPPAHPAKHAATTSAAAEVPPPPPPAPPPPASRPEINPSGGHAPLRPIVTSNPYGSAP
jgi:serine/threonine-protein kinase